MAQTTTEYLQSVLREIATRAAMGAAYETWTPYYARKEVLEAWRDDRSVMRQPRERRVTIAELSAVSVPELRRLGFAGWDENLTVIPLWAWNYIADGEMVSCIDGEIAVKGKDEIDLDVRGGCIAYGFKTPVSETV